MDYRPAPRPAFSTRRWFYSANALRPCRNLRSFSFEMCVALEKALAENLPSVLVEFGDDHGGVFEGRVDFATMDSNVGMMGVRDIYVCDDEWTVIDC